MRLPSRSPTRYRTNFASSTSSDPNKSPPLSEKRAGPWGLRRVRLGAGTARGTIHRAPKRGPHWFGAFSRKAENKRRFCRPRFYDVVVDDPRPRLGFRNGDQAHRFQGLGSRIRGNKGGGHPRGPRCHRSVQQLPKQLAGTQADAGRLYGPHTCVSGGEGSRPVQKAVRRAATPPQSSLWREAPPPLGPHRTLI